MRSKENFTPKGAGATNFRITEQGMARVWKRDSFAIRELKQDFHDGFAFVILYFLTHHQLEKQRRATIFVAEADLRNRRKREGRRGEYRDPESKIRLKKGKHK